MTLWSKRLSAIFPGSLLALIVVTAASVILNLDVPIIGSIRRPSCSTSACFHRASPGSTSATLIRALSIAALGGIEKPAVRHGGRTHGGG
ncbi:MAG: hypothetical protein U0521_12520 [Anaerolineae bacterium]